MYHYQNQQLYVEQVAVAAIAAKYGTPCYVYSQAKIEHNWHAFTQNDFQHTRILPKIFYAVKANSNLALLQLLANLGAGFDTVSQGEIQRVLQATGTAGGVVFSGVGKTRAEIEFALQTGIYCFNVESEPELYVIQDVARTLGMQAAIALRVNPNIDAKTHPYISTGLKENKFGIAMEQVEDLYVVAANMQQIKILGLCCHIGSQITELQPFQAAVRQMLLLAQRINALGYNIQHLNLGGGLGICYQDEQPPTPEQYLQALLAEVTAAGIDIELHLEPGRALIGNAGMLVTKVEYIKAAAAKNFAIVDAGMNDLMRPALYGSKHKIIVVKQLGSTGSTSSYDIVGPICETADCFAKDQTLTLSQGDLLAITNTGAYGSSMSSNYNSRGRCAEVLVAGDQVRLIRQRETLAALYRDELM